MRESNHNEFFSALFSVSRPKAAAKPTFIICFCIYSYIKTDIFIISYRKESVNKKSVKKAWKIMFFDLFS